MKRIILIIILMLLLSTACTTKSSSRSIIAKPTNVENDAVKLINNAIEKNKTLMSGSILLNSTNKNETITTATSSTGNNGNVIVSPVVGIQEPTNLKITFINMNGVFSYLHEQYNNNEINYSIFNDSKSYFIYDNSQGKGIWTEQPKKFKKVSVNDPSTLMILFAPIGLDIMKSQRVTNFNGGKKIIIEGDINNKNINEYIKSATPIKFKKYTYTYIINSKGYLSELDTYMVTESKNLSNENMTTQTKTSYKLIDLNKYSTIKRPIYK